MEEENSQDNDLPPLFIPFQGFWCRPEFIPGIKSFQKHFQALDNDIILATKPKAGTTWIKALVFSIVNRTRYSLTDTPLNSANPHQLVPFLEIMLYANGNVPDLTANTSSSTTPRLFATHLPYSALPESIKQYSNARIVYLARNPLDVIVSFWHFLRNRGELPNWPLEECFEMFCCGEEAFGPFWDHVSGYWNESSKKPNRVLFLRYEDLKEDPISNIKRIAEFVGFPFSEEEESSGVVEGITTLCSFSNLKDLEVNKTGNPPGKPLLPFKSHFREGKVGDHVNHLTPSQMDRFRKIFEEKLSGSGLYFKLS